MRVLEKVTNLLAYLASFCLVFMFIAITVNIILRQFGKGIFGLDEINAYLMSWVCYLAIPVGVRLGRQIDIDILTRRLPLTTQRTLRLVNTSIAAVLFMFVGILSVNMVIASYKTHWVTCELMTPVWLWQLSLPLGTILYSLESIDLLRRIKKGDVQ